MTLPPSPALQRHATPDGISLATYAWPAARAKARALIVHGYLEHAGRYAKLAAALNDIGVSCTTFDLRGHGQSDGKRAHVDSFDRYLADVRSLLATGPTPPAIPTFLLGHSLGGLIALLVAAERRTPLAGLLLSNPYLENAAAISAPKRWLARIAHRAWPTLRAPAGLKTEWMVHDAEVAKAMVADPLIQRHATAGWFYETLRAQARARTLRKLDCPTWFGIGACDPVADPKWNRVFAERLLAPDKRVYIDPKGLHEPLQDERSDAMMAALTAFVDRHCGTGR